MHRNIERGVCEIGSALFKVLSKNKFAIKTKLVICSDICIGLNKNGMLYLDATGKFLQIEQKFLVSHIPCDRDFTHIEKRKRVFKLFVLSYTYREDD